mmetsp:Transcript_30016/g.63182  ORF Transcript_30016/g.63182 Transcript_30016/m.63182 type:complete len:368 (+) Transcript_30016:93-1196(+)
MRRNENFWHILLISSKTVFFVVAIVIVLYILFIVKIIVSNFFIVRPIVAEVISTVFIVIVLVLFFILNHLRFFHHIVIDPVGATNHSRNIFTWSFRIPVPILLHAQDAIFPIPIIRMHELIRLFEQIRIEREERIQRIGPAAQSAHSSIQSFLFLQRRRRDDGDALPGRCGGRPSILRSVRSIPRLFGTGIPKMFEEFLFVAFGIRALPIIVPKEFQILGQMQELDANALEAVFDGLQGMSAEESPSLGPYIDAFDVGIRRIGIVSVPQRHSIMLRGLHSAKTHDVKGRLTRRVEERVDIARRPHRRPGGRQTAHRRRVGRTRRGSGVRSRVRFDVELRPTKQCREAFADGFGTDVGGAADEGGEVT